MREFGNNSIIIEGVPSDVKWGNEEDVSSKILSVVSAGISYGGDGAFFVYLRKNRY